RGHASVLAAAAHDRKNQFARLVAEHDLGAEQIRSAQLAAAQVGAVARAAVDVVRGFPARDDRRIAGRPLLRWEFSAPAAATLALTADDAVLRKSLRRDVDCECDERSDDKSVSNLHDVKRV